MLYPMQFVPVLRDYLWGGRRLGEVLGKPLPADKTAAESWEVVDHGDDQSRVANGALAGKTLGEIVREFPTELFGKDQLDPRGQRRTSFPLLLKYLDCNRDLSVQVHPSDRYAAQLTPPDLGKTEAWYIVDAKPGSKIYAGLQAGVGRDELARAMAAGRTSEVLHILEPQPGDCVFIPAGTVHALGAGLLVAEIQQASDTTFRLFDWNRVDGQGNSRPLHVEQALEVTDYQRGPVGVQSPASAGGRWQRLVACDKSQLHRAEGKGEWTVGDTPQLVILTVPRGSAVVHCDDAEYSLPTGGTLLLPACSGVAEIELNNRASTVLAMQLP